MSLTYEIHPKAQWDNGTAVTGYDYLFTVKAAKHQGWEAPNARACSSSKRLKSIQLIHKNLRCLQNLSSISEMVTGYNLHLLPEYVYDPQQVLRSVDLATLDGDTKRYSTAVQEFADDFSSEKYSSGVKFIVGLPL